MAMGANLSIKQVAIDLGIHANVLSRWCQEQQRDGPKAFRGQSVPRDEELAKLKRELARVKRERDFLKDAAAFFAKDTLRANGDSQVHEHWRMSNSWKRCI